MKLQSLFCFVLIVSIGFLSGCDITTEGHTVLLDPDEAPQAERGGVAADNRFFMISGNQILELDGAHQTSVIYQREDCVFSGMATVGSTIYGACTALGNAIEINGQATGLPKWSDLVRIDLAKAPSDPKYIAETRLGDDSLYPNGMAVDAKGDIYITNTFAVIFQLLPRFSADAIDAISRVRIVDEENFTISKTSALPADQGGMSPNGIQIQGDRLWFVSMNVLYEAQIGDEGLVNLKNIYQTRLVRMFDDFAILPGNRVAIAEFNTVGLVADVLFPNAQQSGAPSQLTFVSTGTGPEALRAGKVIRKHLLPDIIPSSATLVNDAEGAALYVTDYFNGGLYRVDLTE